MLDLEPNARKYPSIEKTEEVFPDLGKIVGNLVDILHVTTDPILQPYKAHVNGWPYPQTLFDTLMLSFDKELKSSQATIVNKASMDHVKELQAKYRKMFNCLGGYIIYFTDSRDFHYCRFLVGQSQEVSARIRSHTNAMLGGSVASLQYYMNAHRIITLRSAP